MLYNSISFQHLAAALRAAETPEGRADAKVSWGRRAGRQRVPRVCVRVCVKCV